MKVTVYKGTEGTFGFAIKRTRRDEGPSQLHRSVAKDDLKQALAKAVQETSPQFPQPPLEPS